MKTYSWYDDDDVVITTVTGDDDWDHYNGHDTESKTTIKFDSLPKKIQEELKAAKQ